jgi:mRNA interferase MazF
MSKKVICPQGFPHRGEIYLVDFNRRKGKEIRKIRPALVISNDIQNEYDRYLTVAPMSSDEMEIIRPFEVLVLKTTLNGLDTDSKILLNQIHSIDHQARLRSYLGKLEESLIKDMEKKIKLVLALE